MEQPSNMNLATCCLFFLYKIANKKIQPPPNSGSFFFNYKHHFSVVLLALVDADYKFIYIDISCNGGVSDGCVLRNSSLSTVLKENTLNIAAPSVLPGVSAQAPFFIYSG